MKALKYIGIALLGLVLIVVTLLAALWVRPELLLNETRIRQAMRWAPDDLKVEWKGFRWDFHRDGWLAKRSDLEIRDLCFSYGKQYEGCLPLFHVDVSFAFRSILPSITRIDTAEIAASKIVMRPGPEEKKKPSPTGPLPDLRAPSFTDFYPPLLTPETLGKVALLVEELRMESKEGPALVASLNLQKEAQENARDINFRLSARAEQGKDLDLRVEGRARIPGGEPSFAFLGDVKGKAAGFNTNVPLNLRWAKGLTMEADPDLRQKSTRYATNIRLQWDQEALKLATGSMVLGQPMERRRLELEKCRFDSDLHANGHPEKSTFSCTFALHARTKTKILPTVQSTLFGEVNLSPKDQETVAADITIKERGERPLLPSHMDARIQGDFNMVEAKLLGTPKLEFAAHFGTENINLWVPILRGTPYSIPAPLNVLAGPVGLDIKLDRVDGRKELGISTVLTTELRGGNQAVITRGDAAIRVTNPYTDKREIFVDGKFVLRDVQLEAPPMGLSLPPNAIPDSRFVTEAQLAAEERAKRAAKATPALPIHWNLSVVNEAPVRIVTNLLPNPIPLAVNLTLSDKADMQGFVQVQPMPIKLFSKVANVNHIKVNFLPKSDLPELDGLLVNKTAEVEIRVILLGNTSAPRVEFESDPPLERDQIVQMLLFNKSLAQVRNEGAVTDEEASSASNVSRAMSEQAFGLFSLFFLSSTPIQSVGYDPSSQTYSIQFKLGNKTSLAVGSNFGGSRQVSVRRSLGGPWAIRTELSQTDQNPNRLLTFLEWFRRF